MLFSNESLKYVNYPTQALAKSCKMIPVLLVDTLFYGKSHGIGKFLFVGFVTSGIILFRSQGSEKDEHNTIFGLFLLFMSLLMDGFTAPKQQELKRLYHPTVYEAMLYCNFWALLGLIALLFVSGEGVEGFNYIALEENRGFLDSLLLFSACSAVGQLVIFYTVHTFGFVESIRFINSMADSFSGL